jgi:hypothetical protein
MPWYRSYGVRGHLPHRATCFTFALLPRISRRELGSYRQIEERELEAGGLN